jgi:hypothetical protein
VGDQEELFERAAVRVSCDCYSILHIPNSNGFRLLLGLWDRRQGPRAPAQRHLANLLAALVVGPLAALEKVPVALE